MDLDFWSIVKILLGIYCMIGLIRFAFYSIAIFFGNLVLGIYGFILGGIAALILKNYFSASLPIWYITVLIGALIGCLINNIISKGIAGYIQMNLSVLWDMFKIAFLFKQDYSRSSRSTRQTNRRNDKREEELQMPYRNSGSANGNCDTCIKFSPNYCSLHCCNVTANHTCTSHSR